MNILVTGGAGYIGSHAVKRLLREGHTPIIFDNLCRGNSWALITEHVMGDLTNKAQIQSSLEQYEIEAVMHFASYAYVHESYEKPKDYFENNLMGSLNLLESCAEVGIKKIIFSSTCSIYGVPENIPITEDHPPDPVNPYGESKLMVERMLRWYNEIYGIDHVCLRYFNVAGCDPEGEIGEWHNPETHVVPNVLMAAMGLKPEFKVFGADYDTPDGTCIRDYMHVLDIVDAHIKALGLLNEKGGIRAYNLGNSRGFSVKELIEASENVTGQSVPVIIADRRKGDPPELVSDSSKARAELGWEPRLSDLDTIMKTHWDWLSSLSEKGII